jgi:hypothetical protein
VIWIEQRELQMVKYSFLLIACSILLASCSSSNGRPSFGKLLVCAMVSARCVVTEEDIQDNLETCSLGSFPSICKHGWLTPSQKITVREAELRENYGLCMLGRFPTVCKHGWLTASQKKDVREAECLTSAPMEQTSRIA